MILKCNRCYHHWKTRKDTKPKVCPACKSTKWEDPLTTKQEKRLTEDMCKRLINHKKHLGYVDLSPQLLLALVVALISADKAFRDGGFSFDSAKQANEILNPLGDLIMEELFPEDLLYTLIRLKESYFRDYLNTKGERRI